MPLEPFRYYLYKRTSVHGEPLLWSRKMNIEKVILKAGKKTIELSLDEVMELRDELNRLTGADQYRIYPYPYYSPNTNPITWGLQQPQ